MPWRRYILMLLCAGFLLAFLVVPVGLAIKEGFYSQEGFTLVWVKGVFTNMVSREGLLNSLKIAVLTTLAVFLLALPLAVLANHYSFRGKRLLTGLLMVPMILPPFVGALAVKKILAREGGSLNLLLAGLGLPKIDWLGGDFLQPLADALNHVLPAIGLPKLELGGALFGVVVLEALHLYPILYLNISAALANVDPTMLEAARGLGASRWKTFWRVTLPMIRPGMFAGGTIVFIWSFTELGTPLMLKYNQVLPVQIFHGLQVLETGPDIYAMVFVMLSSSVALYALGKFFFGRAAAVSAGRGVAATTRKAGAAATALIWLAFGAVTLLAIVPHVGVVLLALAERWNLTILPESFTLRHVQEVFQRADTWNSIVNSLRYASLATAVDIVLGLAIAYLVVRMKVRFGWLLDSLAMLPLAVPGLVIASGYVLMTTRPPDVPLIGPLLAEWSPRKDPMLILVVAYSVRRLPYMVRSISAGLQQTSPALEEAARNLGASPLRSILRITVPLISANVLAGAILTFSFAMLEVSDSLILAQTREYYPITKAIYSLTGVTEPLAAALGLFGMALLTVTLIGANLLLGRRLGAMFRV